MKKIMLAFSLLIASSTSFAVCDTSRLESDIREINSSPDLNPETKLREVENLEKLVFVAEVLACSARKEPITKRAATIAIANIQANEAVEVARLRTELAQLSTEKDEMNAYLAKLTKAEMEHLLVRNQSNVESIRKLTVD